MRKVAIHLSSSRSAAPIVSLSVFLTEHRRIKRRLLMEITPELPEQESDFQARPITSPMSSQVLQVETDTSRAVVDDGGDEPLLRQETDGRKPLRGKRRKKLAEGNASCGEICRENVIEICIGVASAVAIGLLIVAFVYYPSHNEQSMAHAANAHEKAHYDIQTPAAKEVKGEPQPEIPPIEQSKVEQEHSPDSDSKSSSPEAAMKGHHKHYEIRVFDPILRHSISRQYVVYTPPRVQRPKTPAVVVCHGDGETFETTSEWFLMDKLADKEGFLVLYPQGLATGTVSNNGILNPSWNALGTGAGDNDTCVFTNSSPLPKQPTCQQAQHDKKAWLSTKCDRTPCAADTAFVSDMIRKLVIESSVDELQVHATGQGLGGMFAMQLGITLSSQIASVVQVSGAPLVGYNDLPDSPVSLLSIRGSNDRLMPATLAASSNHNPRFCPTNCTDRRIVVSEDGFKYVPEVSVARTWALGAECKDLKTKVWHPSVHISGQSETFFTDEFHRIHGNCSKVGTGCHSNNDIVTCAFKGGHTLPWSNAIHYRGSSVKVHKRNWDVTAKANLLWPRLAWSFMSSHPK